jgi:hypothetical protein
LCRGQVAERMRQSPAIMLRKTLLLFSLLLSHVAGADEPRINRVSPAVKEQARKAIAEALKTGAIADGTAFGEIVQCGPRLWARIHDRFSPDDNSVVRAINLIDGERQAREWGFLLASEVETDPKRKEVAESLAGSRTAIQMAAFRNGGEKRLAPHVARLMVSPAVPVVRDPNEAEIGYLWMLVPYDLDEPIFVIEVGNNRVLVDLDEQHRIDWVDLLPETLSAPE